MVSKSFLVIGNLKQNGDAAYIHKLANTLQSTAVSDDWQAQEVVILPPIPYLGLAAALLDHPSLALGVQMVSGHDSGSRTGCYDARMAAEIGASYVCIGHSERRSYCGDDNEQIVNQYMQTVQAGLRPILCVGETVQERQAGQTLRVIERQLTAVFSADIFKKVPVHDIIVAYEPVWAIGAKSAACIEDVEDVFSYLNDRLKHNKTFASIKLCYGGSVDETNCDQFMRSSTISGLLVGRACLDASRFAKLVTRHKTLCWQD